jgi:hypothetical protein
MITENMNRAIPTKEEVNAHHLLRNTGTGLAHGFTPLILAITRQGKFREGIIFRSTVPASLIFSFLIRLF